MKIFERSSGVFRLASIAYDFTRETCVRFDLMLFFTNLRRTGLLLLAVRDTFNGVFYVIIKSLSIVRNER